jgi:hypothetical protein
MDVRWSELDLQANVHATKPLHSRVMFWPASSVDDVAGILAMRDGERAGLRCRGDVSVFAEVSLFLACGVRRPVDGLRSSRSAEAAAPVSSVPALSDWVAGGNLEGVLRDLFWSFGPMFSRS